MKRTFIIGTLRKLWLKSPERTLAKNSSRISRGNYQCNHCKELFKTKEIQIHHIKPVVASGGFQTWDDYITRLFCDQSGLEALCKPCHSNHHKTTKSNAKNHPLQKL